CRPALDGRWDGDHALGPDHAGPCLRSRPASRGRARSHHWRPLRPSTPPRVLWLHRWLVGMAVAFANWAALVIILVATLPLLIWRARGGTPAHPGVRRQVSSLPRADEDAHPLHLVRSDQFGRGCQANAGHLPGNPWAGA